MHLHLIQILRAKKLNYKVSTIDKDHIIGYPLDDSGLTVQFINRFGSANWF